MTRQYRLPIPEPRECACGCSLFQPMREDQVYRYPACRVAMSNFKRRRREAYRRRAQGSR
jgi:hypothetical protein